MGMKKIVRGSWSYQEQWNYLDFHLFLFYTPDEFDQGIDPFDLS